MFILPTKKNSGFSKIRWARKKITSFFFLSGRREPLIMAVLRRFLRDIRIALKPSRSVQKCSWLNILSFHNILSSSQQSNIFWYFLLSKFLFSQTILSRNANLRFLVIQISMRKSRERGGKVDFTKYEISSHISRPYSPPFDKKFHTINFLANQKL